LLFAPSGSMEPTIADMHTSPGGADLGDPKVLYVATGMPRLMVVTIDTLRDRVRTPASRSRITR
jgi:hypothetical protein